MSTKSNNRAASWLTHRRPVVDGDVAGDEEAAGADGDRAVHRIAQNQPADRLRRAHNAAIPSDVSWEASGS